MAVAIESKVDTLDMEVGQIELARHPVWKALLHLQQGEPQITDPQFLLSWPAFSPEAELDATLNLLRTQGQAAACRFPARALWLRSRLDLAGIDPEKCLEIAEFVLKAPFDRLDLVFADESVTQPASMLGHSFLRVSGERQGQSMEHAVSFYTQAESINLPKLLWDSLVTGKEGLFSLTPYADEERKYLEGEQRNLWRYRVRTTAFERALIRNHLFELKNSQLTYFFHRYNCATALRNILGLGGDLPPGSPWVTPKQIVKDLHAAGRIENTQVQLADSWIVSHVASNMPEAAKIRQMLLNSPLPADWPGMNLSEERYMALQAYNRWLWNKGTISAEAYSANALAIKPKEERGDDVAFQVDAGLDPKWSGGETYWRTEWRRDGSSQKLLLQWTPASHALMQPRGQATAETEMILLSPTLSVDNRYRFRLEELQVFSMKSWVPWDPLLRPWSTQTLIGYGSVTGHPLEPRGVHASLQLGGTARLNALDLYAVTGPGVRTNVDTDSMAYLRTDLGGLWRHRDMAKSRLAWTHWTGATQSAWRLEVEQSWFLKANWMAAWRYSATQQFSTRARGVGVFLMHSF